MKNFWQCLFNDIPQTHTKFHNDWSSCFLQGDLVVSKVKIFQTCYRTGKIINLTGKLSVMFIQWLLKSMQILKIIEYFLPFMNEFKTLQNGNERNHTKKRYRQWLNNGNLTMHAKLWNCRSNLSPLLKESLKSQNGLTML